LNKVIEEQNQQILGFQSKERQLDQFKKKNAELC
jgi:hypothetical protein